MTPRAAAREDCWRVTTATTTLTAATSATRVLSECKPTGNDAHDSEGDRMKWKRGTSTEHVRDERGQGGSAPAVSAAWDRSSAAWARWARAVASSASSWSCSSLFLGGKALTGGGGGFDVGDVLEDVTGVQPRPPGNRCDSARPAHRLRHLRVQRHPVVVGAAVRVGLPARGARAVQRARRSQACGFADSGVGPALLPGRRHRSHRHRLLPRAVDALRGAR